MSSLQHTKLIAKLCVFLQLPVGLSLFLDHHNRLVCVLTRLVLGFQLILLCLHHKH